MPQGTCLRLRFFVGDTQSNIRDCYWGEGALVNQIWMPDSTDPPKVKDLVVGVEVLRNLRHHLRGRDPRRVGIDQRRGIAREDVGKWAGLAGQPGIQGWPRSASTPRTPTARRAAADQCPDELAWVGQLGTLRTAAGLRTAVGLVLPSPRFMSPGTLNQVSPRRA